MVFAAGQTGPETGILPRAVGLEGRGRLLRVPNAAVMDKLLAVATLPTCQME